MTKYQALLAAAREQPPHVALILGSGLHVLAERLTPRATVAYAEIPDMSATTIAGHPGELLLGTWTGVRVLVFVGRLHRYEGHPPECLARPACLAHELGASIYLATNSAGGIAQGLTPPCLLAVTSHLDCARPYCWRHAPTMAPYAPALLAMMDRAATGLGLPLHRGTYAQVTGPNYETPAEVRALRAMGIDAVGMSTAVELDMAHELGLKCAAVSAITNRAAGLGGGPLSHDEVIGNAGRLAGTMAQLIERLLREIAASQWP